MIPTSRPLRLHALVLAVASALPAFAALAETAPVADGASADAASATSGSDATMLDAITVVSTGTTRQVQRITREDIGTAAPGTSALKVLDKLPGVQFQSADAWGAYEWSTAITLHGFDQSRLGFTLDGIPLGTMNYGVSDGLQVTRAIISENVGSVELAQGAGALGTASSSNLGGTVRYYSDDPDAEPGIRFSQTFGSDSARRTYLRGDIGDLNGFSMYTALVHGETDKWKGYGNNEYSQANVKALYQWGDGNRVSLFLDSSKRKEYDIMDLSLTSQKALGWDWDYLMPDWNSAVQIANALNGNGSYPASLNALPADYGKADASYYSGAGLRDDNLAALSGAFNLGGTATLNLAGYYHDNTGEGQWTTPYVPSSATVPLSMRTTDYRLNRHGVTASLNFTVAGNEIEIGGWYQNAKTVQERNYFLLDGAFTDLFYFNKAGTRFERGFSQHYETDTRMFYAQDTLRLLDERLTVNFGAKKLQVDTTSQSLVPTTSYAVGEIKADSDLLPQVGVNYKLDEHQEIYASYNKNMAGFGFTPFQESQAAFDAIKSSLEPETAQTYELGYRVRGDGIEASLALYHTTFDDRLLVTSPCTAIQTCAATLNNVGSVRSQGADLAVMWRPIAQLRWLNSLSYNDATYQDDYLSGGVVATAGKRVVGIPEWMFSSSLAYENAGWHAALDGKYTGRRYISYLNDSSVPSYWRFDLSAGYDFGQVGMFQNLGLSANVTNLLDKRYFATVGTNGYVVSDPNGYNQTLMAGAPRQFFVTFSGKF
ncbi:TonB-dependent receptor [Xanthomonas sp. NCPPB 2654]|uniref:TonB-dependent receptor n=1 Tax=unclassified Xanthomonas TaxID=2643310 RepID=UPI0021E0D69B|nr:MULTISPECIES: TonB-dependent receptor [unclassified Xanthomonas]MDL5365226.1 TonB-dependent receptor [Xanthomonas sp. NCPPB 2654]UYC19709.1 TonB-dependent receptor [Xanthomonas sp. CFBP 8443]